MRHAIARLLLSSIFLTLASYSAAFARCQPQIITSAASLTLADDSCAIGIKRPRAVPTLHQRLKLPPHPSDGKVVYIADLAGNFRQNPIDVIPNAGQRIADAPEGTELNINGASWSFRFFSTGADTGVWAFSKQ